MPASELSRRDWGAHERAAATAIQSCEHNGAQDGDSIEGMAKLGDVGERPISSGTLANRHLGETGRKTCQGELLSCWR